MTLLWTLPNRKRLFLSGCQDVELSAASHGLKWKISFAGLGKSVTTSNLNRLHGLIGRPLSQDAFGLHLFDIK